MTHHDRRLWLASCAVAMAACSGSGTSATATASSAGGGGSDVGSTTNGPGPGPVTSSSGGETTGSGASASSSATSGGGGDAGWRPVPWWNGTCALEYAENPVEALPTLEWTTCTDAPEGCEVLVKNWPPLAPTGQTVISVRRSGGKHEVGISVVMEGNDARVLLVGGDGTARVAYRRPPTSGCNLSRLFMVEGGHWSGGQDVESISTYVFQPEGRPPEDALVLPLTSGSQRQAGGDGIFAIELMFAAGIQIFDQARGQVFTTPAGTSSYDPKVSPLAVFFTRPNGPGDPTGWVWDRPSGDFRELIGADDGVVADLRGDEETLVWIKAPLPKGGGGAGPGVLYTSPFTTEPKAIVPSARWSNLPVSPGALATMGGGYYAAVSESTRSIYILRLSDGRRWTIPIPNDEFTSPVKSFPYIDEDLLFVVTETQIHRIHMDALGPGMPAE